MKIKTIALLALLPLVSCVQTETTKLDPSANYAPIVEPEAVKIYLAAEDLPPGTKKIAVIDVSGDNDFTSIKGFVETVKEEAAKLGANAVLVVSMRKPSAGEQIAGAFLGYSARRQAQYIAVRTP